MAFLDSGQRSAAPSVDTEGKLRNELLGQIANILRTMLPRVGGTFTLTAAATLVVAEPSTTSASFIQLTPLNAGAATLMGSNKSLYISARTAGASFTVATASGVAATGGEQFQYTLVNLV